MTLNRKTLFAFLLPLFCFCFSSTPAQSTFQLSVGDAGFDHGGYVTHMPDGRIAFTGTVNTGIPDYLEEAMIVMVDSTGSLLWRKNTGIYPNSEGTVALDVIGSVIFQTGNVSQGVIGGADGFIQKFDPNNGTLLKTAILGIPNYQSVFFYGTCVSADRHLYAAGAAHFQGGDMDLLVSKWDTNLTRIWSKSYGSLSRRERARAVCPTADGGLLVGGTSSTGFNQTEAFFLKLDSSGNVVWNRIYGGPFSDEVKAVTAIPGGYFAVGSHWGGAMEELMLMKLDLNGNLLWTKAFHGINDQSANALLWDGTAAWLGGKFSGGGAGALIAKLDTAGNVLLSQVYGDGDEEFNSIDLLPDGRILAGGTTGSFTQGGENLYLVCADSSGYTPCFSLPIALSDTLITLPPIPPLNLTVGPVAAYSHPTWTAYNQSNNLLRICDHYPCNVEALASVSSSSLCPGDSFVAYDQSIGADSITWLLNGNPIHNGSSVVISPTIPGLYLLDLVAADSMCTDTAHHNFQLRHPTQIVTNGDTLCTHDTLIATNATPGAFGGHWTVNGTNYTNSSTSIGFALGNWVGTYHIYLESVPGGCPDSTEVVVVPSPLPIFYHSQGPVFNFLNESFYGISYFWDFGDGNTSTLEEPQHMYNSSGTYTVCLTVTGNYGCTRTLCRTIVYVGTEEAWEMPGLRTWPNPAGDVFFLDIPVEAGKVEVELWDVRGRKLGEWAHTPGADLRLDVRELPAGLYEVVVRGKKSAARVKMVKQ